MVFAELVLCFRGFIVAPRLTTAGKPEGALESAEVRDKVLGSKNGLRVPLCSTRGTSQWMPLQIHHEVM